MKEIERRLMILEGRFGQEDSVDVMDLYGALRIDTLESLIGLTRRAMETCDAKLAERIEEAEKAYLAGEVSLEKAKEMLEGVIETATKRDK